MTASHDSLSWASVDACTLPTAQRPLRVAEFDQLFADALQHVEPRGGKDTRARLQLSGGPDLPSLVEQLVAKESSCCSFFRFTVTATADVESTHVALDIEVPAAHADVLAALVDRARTVARQRTTPGR